MPLRRPEQMPGRREGADTPPDELCVFGKRFPVEEWCPGGGAHPAGETARSRRGRSSRHRRCGRGRPGRPARSGSRVSVRPRWRVPPAWCATAISVRCRVFRPPAPGNVTPPTTPGRAGPAGAGWTGWTGWTWCTARSPIRSHTRSPPRTGVAWSLLLAGEDAATRADPWFVRVGDYPGVGSALAFDRPIVLDPGARISRSLSVSVLDGIVGGEKAFSVLASARGK
jgi:methane monooxygenase PmoA-like